MSHTCAIHPSPHVINKEPSMIAVVEQEPFEQSVKHEAWELRMNEAKDGGPMSVIPSAEARSPETSNYRTSPSGTPDRVGR